MIAIHTFINNKNKNDYEIISDKEKTKYLKQLLEAHNSIDNEFEELKTKVIDLMFRTHIRLIIKLVGKHLKSRRLADDLLSEAYLMLIISIKRFIDKLLAGETRTEIRIIDNEEVEIINITGYIIFNVQHKIKRLLIKEYKNSKILRTNSALKNIKSKNNNFIETKEIIESILSKLDTVPHEKEVFDMRIAGYNDREIGDKLNLSKAHIGKIRKVIRGKLRRIINCI